MTASLLKRATPFSPDRATVTSDIVSNTFGSDAPHVHVWALPVLRDAAYLAFEALDSTTLLEYQDADELEDGWAGEGTFAPSEQTLTVVRRVLFDVAGLLAQPTLTPNDSGTVSLEWRTSRGHALLEVGDSKYGLLVRRSGGPSVHLNGSVRTLFRELLVHVAGLLGPTRATSIY